MMKNMKQLSLAALLACLMVWGAGNVYGYAMPDLSGSIRLIGHDDGYTRKERMLDRQERQDERLIEKRTDDGRWGEKDQLRYDQLQERQELQREQFQERKELNRY